MNKKLVVSVLLTIIYAVITLIAVLHHEIWADEAQVWQLCKYLSLPELFNHLHNEGHPSFFYLLVMPFAKLTSNIIYMQLICWFAMCIAVFLLIYKAPFPNIVKFAIITSAGFFYFLPVMARDYSLIPVLVFLAAILYSKRKEQPILYAVILFLLTNTHSIMLGLVGILLLLFCIETIKEAENKKQRIIGIIIIIFGILALIWQLHDTTSNNASIIFKAEKILMNLIKVPMFFFINSYNQMITIEKRLLFPIIDLPAILILIIDFILLFINLFINNKKLFLISFCGIFFQFAIYILVYPNFQYVTRIFSAYIILLLSFWILYSRNDFNEAHKISKKSVTTVLLSVFFFLTCYNGINFYKADYQYNYSGAKETSEYIKNNLPKDSLILIFDEPWNLANMYYLQDEYKLYSLVREKNINYIVWDDLHFKRPDYDYIKKFCDFNSEYSDNIYILFTNVDRIQFDIYKKPLDEVYSENFTHIFTSAPSVVKDESFSIYRYNK